MKELSIEQKTKAYDEAISKLQNLITNANKQGHIIIRVEDLENSFPELKESEDEKIRKDIIRVLKGEISFVSEKENEKYIAWLEKQGGPNPYSGVSFEYNDHAWGMCARDGGVEIGIDGNLKAFISSDKSFIFHQPSLTPKSALEAAKEDKFDNQNCVNPTNNPEPKFREGDWLIENHPNNYARFVQILEIINIQGNNKYRISRDLHNDEDVTECLFIEDNWHPFNTQDAKAGDVLFGRYGTFIFMGKGCGYCGVLSDNTFIRNTGNNEWTEDLYPATKNQRDLLFKKMRKAGYEWDADKNEPKIIDWSKFIKYNPNATSTAEEKPTWTEKDEKIRKEIISALKFLETELKWDFIEDDEIDISDVYDWLEKQSNKV